MTFARGEPVRFVRIPHNVADGGSAFSLHAFANPMLGSLTHADLVWAEMEYVDSQTLKEQIERGFDDDAETWRIARQILSAMTHYVSLHIIHRDLKPSNIFLDAKVGARHMAKVFH